MKLFSFQVEKAFVANVKSADFVHINNIFKIYSFLNGLSSRHFSSVIIVSSLNRSLNRFILYLFHMSTEVNTCMSTI